MPNLPLPSVTLTVDITRRQRRHDWGQAKRRPTFCALHLLAAPGQRGQFPVSGRHGGVYGAGVGVHTVEYNKARTRTTNTANGAKSGGEQADQDINSKPTVVHTAHYRAQGG